MSDSEWEVYPSRPERTPEPQRGSSEPARPEAPWYVLVEYANRGDAKPPTKMVFAQELYPTLAAALVAAERMAFQHRPPDPLSPQGRQVYRDGNGFVTIVKGAVSTFHFSTRAVQYVGHRDR